MAGLDAAGLEHQVESIWPAQPAVLAAAGGRPGAPEDGLPRDDADRDG